MERCEKSLIMRIEINLTENIVKAIQKKANAVNQSRKGYIEFLCMQDAKPLIALEKRKERRQKK